MPASWITPPKSFPTFERRPWLYFFVFALTNALLSYGPFGLQAKLWIGLAGWALPLGLAFLPFPAKVPGKPDYLQETLPDVPGWAWAAVFSAAFLLRLIPLLNSYWIVQDDGSNCFIPIEMSRDWKWYSHAVKNNPPPFSYWLQAFYFKILTPSIFSSRLLQFLLSLLSVTLYGAVCRRFFPRGLAFLVWSLFSLSFWPLYCFKFSSNISLTLVWELMALFLTALLLTSPANRKPYGWLLCLGLVNGLGFWVAVPWLLVPLLLIPPLFFKFKERDSRTTWLMVLSFGTPLLLTGASYFLLLLHPGGTAHIQWLLNQETGAGRAQRLGDLFSNWTCLFWRGDPQGYVGYSPVWGGMLHPLEGALCFLGLAGLARNRRFPFPRWIGAGLVIFMVPGLLTNAYQIFHDLLVLPLLYFLCALGAQTLLKPLPTKARLGVFGGLILISIPFSVTQLVKTYDPSPTSSSKAFQVLNSLQAREGPGLLFLDLRTDTEDETLTLAAYSFNAAENPSLTQTDSHWAAVICNAHYRYFLSKRFADAAWYELGPDGFWNQGNLALGVFPVHPNNRILFEKWLLTDQLFHAIEVQLYSNPSPVITDGTFREFLKIQGSTREDAFLQSVFCEKAVFYQKDKVAPPQLLPWIQKAIQEGYPAPHLLVEEGLLLKAQGRPQEARRALERALRSPSHSTSASSILQPLGPSRKSP